MFRSAIALSLLLALAACTRATPPMQTSACLDPAKIRKDAMCPMNYAPVCGCDGQTYSNACVAGNTGITTFTQGECPTSTTN